MRNKKTLEGRDDDERIGAVYPIIEINPKVENHSGDSELD